MFTRLIANWRTRRRTRWWKIIPQPTGTEAAFLQAIGKIQGERARDAYLRLQNVSRFIPPIGGDETIAVDVMHPKSAAVFYDRL